MLGFLKRKILDSPKLNVKIAKERSEIVQEKFNLFLLEHPEIIGNGNILSDYVRDGNRQYVLMAIDFTIRSLTEDQYEVKGNADKSG